MQQCHEFNMAPMSRSDVSFNMAVMSGSIWRACLVQYGGHVSFNMAVISRSIWRSCLVQYGGHVWFNMAGMSHSIWRRYLIQHKCHMTTSVSYFIVSVVTLYFGLVKEYQTAVGVNM